MLSCCSMMKHLPILLAVLFVLSLSARASAQVTLTMTNVGSAAQASGFTYKLYVTPAASTTQGAAILAPLTCSGTAPTVTCTGPTPAAWVTAGGRVSGAKSVVTATDTVDGTGESLQSVPFSPGAAVPGSLLIQ